MASDADAKRRRLERSTGATSSSLPVPLTLRVPGLVLKDRYLRVPLDYSGQVGEVH